MREVVNFTIQDHGPISQQFLQRGLTDFTHAADFVRRLPYQRNADKTNLASIFAEGGATCGPKHALLRQLALENEVPALKLKLGLFRMNGQNTPRVAATLARHGLKFLPEAHNYLRFGRAIIDCTRPGACPDDFKADLLVEIEIEPADVATPKAAFHQTYLRYWLGQNPDLGLSFAQLWDVREQCIRELALA